MLFNPNAFAVSEEVRLSLAHFPEIEFLPIELIGFGTFFVVHVTRAPPLSDGSSVRQSPVSKSIVELFAFPKSYVPSADFFRVAPPEHSLPRELAAREAVKNNPRHDVYDKAARPTRKQDPACFPKPPPGDR